MKTVFKDAGYGLETPDFYFGEVVEDNGELKLEWNDPNTGAVTLLTETGLRLKEEESRLALFLPENTPGTASWKIQRNTNYSAEYGLAALQEHKRSLGKPLETGFRPVIPSFPIY